MSNSTSPKLYENPISGVSGELDSTSEDCSTGIVLAPAEFSGPSQVTIADIENPGTAPEAVFTPDPRVRGPHRSRCRRSQVPTSPRGRVVRRWPREPTSGSFRVNSAVMV